MYSTDPIVLVPGREHSLHSNHRTTSAGPGEASSIWPVSSSEFSAVGHKTCQERAPLTTNWQAVSPSTDWMVRKRTDILLVQLAPSLSHLVPGGKHGSSERKGKRGKQCKDDVVGSSGP